jgi:hypothetical protein
MTRISEADYARIVAQQQRPTRQATALPCPTEAQEQEIIVQWAATYPGADLLFHVPNGGERPKHAARAMARAGVKPGVPDLCLPVARGGWHGLWIELKRADHSNVPSPAQRAWLERLIAEGYLCAVCYGANEAIDSIERYLEMR